MAELQSCIGLVKACSALCEVQQEAKAENMGDMKELLAELQRERQKNAELLDKISALEAQIQIQDGKEKGSFAPHFNDSNGQDCCPERVEERGSKKLKRQKIEPAIEELGTINGRESIKLSASNPQHDADFISLQESKLENGLVSWMSMDDNQALPLEKCKDAESALQCEDTDDSDDEDGPYSDDDTDNCASLRDSCAVNDDHQGSIVEIRPMNSIGKNHYDQNEINVPSTSQKVEQHWGEPNKNMRIGNLSLQKKPPKVAFCPKEVRGILESHALGLKNAQSHTMRKIIVFASLGTRHGCEDMYDLDYNHFTILRKGEPYISPSHPGEHVLYENPGVKRKVFYPNRHNPALCPVQILEEEKAMRPSDASCPSCLFLCIKYGGRTRNIPQNEYVRQRMGRNKLKSFGPLICQVARLVKVRTGSFFFKALGITLLFMAGFPDDIVQRETKYRNLDLLQKYYRTDEDAAGEELFTTDPSPSDLGSSALQKLNSKTTAKSKGKKQISSSTKGDTQKPPQAIPTTSMTPTTQFGLVGYTSTQNPPKAAFQATPSRTLIDTLPTSTPLSNSTIISSRPNLSYNHHHALYPMFPPQPANAMIPFMFWPSPHNAYPTFPPHPPPSYGYRALSAVNGGHYISISPHPYYSQGLGPCASLTVPSSIEEGRNRNGHHVDEAAISDSESSSSNTEPQLN